MRGDLFRRIGYSCPIHFSPRGQVMLLASALTHDVHNFYSANQERIAYERPVTAPRDRFSAHDRRLLLLRSFDQRRQAFLKILRLHIVGKTAE